MKKQTDSTNSSSACRQCGDPIQWTKVDGNWRCFNAGTETDHWDLCSKRRAENITRTGQAFSEKRGRDVVTGFRTNLKNSGEMLTRIDGKPIKGKSYVRDDNCKQCVPPWEKCPNGCGAEFST
jgi:hypothetical protein